MNEKEAKDTIEKISLLKKEIAKKGGSFLYVLNFDEGVASGASASKEGIYFLIGGMLQQIMRMSIKLNEKGGLNE